MPTLRYTSREQQLQHVSNWQASGLTRKQYAHQHQLSPKTLARWIINVARPLTDKPETAPFIPAIVTPASSPTTAAVTLNLARCSITCQPDQLAAIMAELNLCSCPKRFGWLVIRWICDRASIP
ncbi:IS66 family insertion sequence element accessory protein TnpA [Xenorhabdus entomophaga]|uniref:IS66 family insertion sequence element accessory protein TnpA n=1 Tax=Xenorhabdus entomophaga TaxID=3136257 RepID=UPI0030F412D0